ncbi:ubiquinone/menaquinone biosynthesis methyltransferase [Lacunisphaera limnophila]|uniref:Ubiquinone/menaquinone biosynthesis methyltransferase n=1 Tax=Lacunisphaera limnophila TaxID=1838286 RepID=A0A1I7PI19_9BACT|nr:class I SAM-dependent methyltransferase [Lacunisphaera limnophila]AOS43272.1 ubiquinone/menaquinone biosynthesis methyltransferase [Lacunisphaera limnophila]
MRSRFLPSLPAAPERPPGIEAYYRMHAGIYDATRWSFLFGRDAILERAAAAQPAPARILEVGCGTGRNLVALARRFPRAQITGVDLSGEMLAIARRKTTPYGSRVTLLRRAYDAPVAAARGHQLVLCSYALSMFNPGFEAAIEAARRDLVPGGHLALVDFHATRQRWFARWMGVNHVRMDGHLRPLLRETLSPVTDRVCRAYGGVWEYLLYVGRKA